MTNTKPQHTPAPWVKHKRKNNGGNYDIKAGSISVACVYYPEWGYDAPKDDNESEANARLIAAAPELLNALQRLTHPQADDSDLTYALEVIKQAKGE
jgi:hypothetical protein